MPFATSAASKTLSISDFTERLRALPHSAFADIDGMERFITLNRVDPASLEPGDYRLRLTAGDMAYDYAFKLNR